MSDPLREAATRLADEWQHGTADDEYCERLDVACAALREALVIEPEYEYRAVAPAGTADPDEYGPPRSSPDDARGDLEHMFGLAPDDPVNDPGWIERSPAREWERLP